MSTPSRRKLTLAVGDETLRRELAELLRGQDLEVKLVPALEGDALADLAADAVVVRSERLEDRPQLLSDAREEEAPGVVVLGDESASEEARLVAAGASAVLDEDLPATELRQRLAELVEAESRGGLHGPEAGGARAEPQLADFQSQNPRMRAFLELVRRVAETDSTLLVTGETGVGKERLARAIHAESARRAGPFVSVNCGALPENLLESELFGHERGAFTGASSARAGRFEEAHGGTLFLDEIGEMPQHLQVKLLTVLQRREVRRLGSEAVRAVDVRIVSATNRDLREEIDAGRFREDLFFRLNVVALEIPPLRERPEDLPQLAGRFVRHFAGTHDRPEVQRIEPAAMRALLAYDWPGNVRELVNVIERAVLLCAGDPIGLIDLPADLGAPRAADATRASEDPELFELPLADARRRLLDGFERRYLEHHLAAANGAVGETAARAGINPRTLYEKMRRLGLRKDEFS